MTAVEGVPLLEPGDGSLGPLLRVTDDRLPPGAGYGVHAHRAVDVVAVVLEGSLTHRWGGDAPLAAGDVGVLRAGAGLDHDEVAGPAGARVLQCHLRAGDPGAAPSHEVLRAPAGWVDLGRPDARLWLGDDGAGVPDGVVLRPGGGRAVVWAVDAARPDWAG
ncbi:pirin family protein [Geodermatophilus sp. FMUSA9-8]|uniref:pirin family protein n=1 Tax=Geodermatophilus sp. FMUSA9-8 TaxID=3120155 RepID=UPI003009E2EB